MGSVFLFPAEFALDLPIPIPYLQPKCRRSMLVQFLTRIRSPACYSLFAHLLVWHVQVTLALQPLFKRSVTLVPRDESDMVEQVALWGGLHEFGDIVWLPQDRKVIYREDNRVDVSTPGNGLLDFHFFCWSLPAHQIIAMGVEGAVPSLHTVATTSIPKYNNILI